MNPDHSSFFASWATRNPIQSHVVLPGIVSMLLMAMYFSGNIYLQNIVAPRMESMPVFSAREFGALEFLQNFVLLIVIYYSVRCLKTANGAMIKLTALLLVLVSLFTFLEEVDYGRHFVEYFTGEHGSLALETWNRNLHNKSTASGVQIVSYIKLASKIILVAGFVLAPLLLSWVRNPTIRLLLPSKWMISTVILIVLLSLLAHGLDDAGLAIIDDVQGILYRNISEFRELNMYYLFMLYTATLYERIIARSNININ